MTKEEIYSNLTTYEFNLLQDLLKKKIDKLWKFKTEKMPLSAKKEKELEALESALSKIQSYLLE